MIAVADPFPTGLANGAHIDLAIHVVSDLHDPLTGAEVIATVQHPDGSMETRRYAGAIGADAVELIATLPIVIRGTGELALTLDFAATSPDGPVAAHNLYRSPVG